MFNYCMMTHLQHYLFMALTLVSFAYLVTRGFSARHLHISFKYVDPLAIYVCSAYLFNHHGLNNGKCHKIC